MSNQQLLDYIKQQQKAGVDNENIKTALVQNGWSNADVDEAFSASLFVSTVPKPSIKSVDSKIEKIESISIFNKKRQLDSKFVWVFFFSKVFSLTLLVLLGFVYLTIIGNEMNNSSIYDMNHKDDWLPFLFWGKLISSITVVFMVMFTYFFSKLTYRFYKYELTDTEYKAERGIIWKRYVSIPYERIQNIDIYRGVLDRLFGLSRLQIQTAGYGASGVNGKGGSEGSLPGLSVQDAELIREELLKRARSTNQVVL